MQSKGIDKLSPTLIDILSSLVKDKSYPVLLKKIPAKSILGPGGVGSCEAMFASVDVWLAI